MSSIVAGARSPVCASIKNCNIVVTRRNFPMEETIRFGGGLYLLHNIESRCEKS